MRTGRGTLFRGFLGLGLLATIAPMAVGQQAPRDFFTQPVLVLNGGGHHAPVKAMEFATTSGSQLLTGGMDKVINVWNLDADRSAPARTLRMPNWRGFRGQVNAMALSPRDDGGNQRLLAVAGYGVLGEYGEILLIRYPGPTGQGTGDIEGQLSAIPAQPGQPAQPGHTNSVMSLAFTPDGQFLASAGNDMSVRIWSIATKRQVSVMDQARGAINSIAIFDQGKKLVAGGNDGVLRLYDITNRAQPVFIAQDPPAGRAAPFPLENNILKVAVSPNNLWIVVGTEGSQLTRYDADLRNPATLKATNVLPAGAILGLAISPDNKLLATSTVTSRLARQADFPAVSCEVQVRSMPGGQVVGPALPPVENLVHAIAFSPDSNRLAYSGGNAQSIYVKDLAVNSPPRDEIKGQGASLWDVNFRADSRAVRFARSRPGVVGPAPEYEYFDLRGRFFFIPAPNEPAYRRAEPSEAGWTIRPIDQFQLEWTNPQRPGRRVSLDPTFERRWWAYTVIPPSPDHPQPVAAVATETGVVLWNMITGVKTRFFNGHAGPVYTLASSPDGKWLVTGSSDQTVRIWSLGACDRIPVFGARFEQQPGGSWVVAEVTPGGFADAMALKKGHVIERFYVADYGPAVEYRPGDFLPRLDQESPTKVFTFYARMPGSPDQFQALITKRDSPALSLFPGVDHRWVLWTPKGQYDSSADGDRRFLGWLSNRGTPGGLLAGSFDSIDKFERRFRQPKAPVPNVIDGLFDPALAAVPAVPPNAPDPATSRLAALAISPAVVVPTDGPVVANQPTLRVNYQALAVVGAAGISRLWVEVNGRKLPDIVNIPANGQALRQTQGFQDLPIGNDRDIQANIVAIDERGVRRVQSLEVSNAAQPRPKPRKSKLKILAFGADKFNDKRFPPIAFADNDAKDLATFFTERMVDPATSVRFAADQVNARTFLGPQVTGANFLAAFDDLNKAGPTEGDVVVIVIESHYLDLNSKRLLATTEPNGGPAPPSFSASDLAIRLGEFTKLGTRAIVLVDAIHEVKDAGWESNIQEWVRQLQAESKAIAFIASDHVPSSSLGENHRMFAQEVIDSLKVKNASRLKKRTGNAMSLFDFQRTVSDGVLQKTGRRQHVQCYLPDTISFQIPLIDESSPEP